MQSSNEINLQNQSTNLDSRPSKTKKPVNSILKLYNNATKLPMGKQIFSKALCLKAPYFSSINPLFVDLKAGYCEASMKKRRAITNHLGTVHAIAMCNLCELVGGTAIEASIDSNMRWIPKGMTVEYLDKATTDLVAKCNIADWSWSEKQEVPLEVNVYNTNGTVVMRAVISMWVSPKR